MQEHASSSYLGLVLIILATVAAFWAWSSIQQQAQKASQSIPHNASTVPGCPAPAPTSTTDYPSLARQSACDAGIQPTIFERQIKQESGFNPRALSPAGAQGIAQFMPSTARGLGVDPWNTPEALKAAARLMARYVQQYGGDYAKALAAYNAGPGAVQSAINTGGNNWRAQLPSETRGYIAVILQEG
jgi:soluble lytic murein transglycosylase-like protein